MFFYFYLVNTFTVLKYYIATCVFVGHNGYYTLLTATHASHGH